MKTALTATNIRVFEAVARLQSVTRAAEELETSQPYISKQIAMLEEQLNLPLFSRAGRRLHLTLHGEMLQKHANMVVDSLKRAEDLLAKSAASSCRQIRIATITTGVYLLPEWLPGLPAKIAERG